MKRHLFKALFLGALVLSSGTFVSCSDSNDDLESRVTTLEGYVNEIQEQLKKALVTGASVVDVKKDDNGSWTLKLSDNTEIVIAGGTGGSNISVASYLTGSKEAPVLKRSVILVPPPPGLSRPPRLPPMK